LIEIDEIHTKKIQEIAAFNEFIETAILKDAVN